MFDYLDKLITLAQIHGEVNIQCEFQGSWQIQPQIDKHKGLFHLIEQGECWLTLGDKSFHLKAGDIFFLPQHLFHTMASQSKIPALSQVDLSQKGIFELHKIGQGTPNLKMFCGTFYYQKPSLLIDALPAYLHLSLNDSPLQPLLQLFLNEAQQAQIGSKSVIDALATILFIQILRHALQLGLLNQGLLAALQDKRLYPVLWQMLNAPQEDWNMQKLAALATMSRANFIRVFHQKIGIPPGKFLSQIRLQQAALLLKTTQKNILQIALEVGYQSEAHFSKAFKRYFGILASEFRKQE
ncbi:AraC family transcriptional regulator [Pelistega sp. NLN82]|uniref:AraC family transcriptional regulator n=1 Tax=Pelistega ratti TaxID=2652177 RepID=A0A6L9Y466_9BURK|nr:AraC family transcriptional regulator [Pelistega ratti]NEN75016.1 AraC family transcriptional regulator [Pelistega ratti]